MEFREPRNARKTIKAINLDNRVKGEIIALNWVLINFDNEALLGVVKPSLIRIYRVECLTEDGDIEVNGHFKDRKIAELMKAEHDMNKRNIKYGIKQNIVEIILEG